MSMSYNRYSRSITLWALQLSLLGCTGGPDPRADAEGLSAAVEALTIPQGNRCFGKADADEFGRTTVHGDFDGDGDLDLAVAAPRDEQSVFGRVGAVYVFRRSPNGLAPWARLNAWDLELQWPEVARFGASLAAADFNGDGRAELAIGRPGSRNAGLVAILNTDAAGGFVVGQVLQRWGAGDGTDADFGASLAAGDFDADGNVDLAIGAPGDREQADVHVGRVYVARGGDAQFTNWFVRAATQMGSAPESGGRFGTAIAAGDFDGNGKTDLVVGSPEESVAEGALYLLRSGVKPLVVSNRFFGKVYVTQGAERSFGTVLAAGDFDGNGRDDVAVGVPTASYGSDERTGATVMLRGTATTLSHASVLQLAYPGAEQGRFLGAGDFDGNGAVDLAVGQLPYGSIGSLQVFRGRIGNTMLLSKTYSERELLGVSTVDVTGDGKSELFAGTGTSRVIFGSSSNGLMPSFTDGVAEQQALCAQYWGTPPTLSLVTRGSTTLRLRAESQLDPVSIMVDRLGSDDTRTQSGDPPSVLFRTLSPQREYCFGARVLLHGSHAWSEHFVACYVTNPPLATPTVTMLSRTATSLTVHTVSNVPGTDFVTLDMPWHPLEEGDGSEFTRQYDDLEPDTEYCLNSKAHVATTDEYTRNTEACFRTLTGSGGGEDEVVTYPASLAQIGEGAALFGHEVRDQIGPQRYLTEVEVAGNNYTPYEVQFLAPGQDYSDCGNPTGVIVRPGESLEGADLESLYGSTEPALPVVLLACKRPRNGGGNDLDPMPIQVTYRQ